VRLVRLGAAPRARRGCARRRAGQGHTPASGWCVYTGSGGARAAAPGLRARGKWAWLGAVGAGAFGAFASSMRSVTMN
jgi:hypothetical protein